MTDHKDHPLLGMGAALAAFVLLTVMTTMAKLLSTDYHVIELAFYRNFVAVIPFAIYMALRGGREKLKTKKPFLIIGRAFLGTFSLTATFAAFAQMPMADVTALLFASSLFIPILSVLFLHEHVGPYRLGAIAVGFIGVLIMVRPTGDVNMIGIGFALAAAMMQAGLGTILRLLKTEDPITVAFYFLVIGTILTGLAFPFVGKGPSMKDLWPILVMGLSGAMGQFLLTTAFKYTQAAVVMIFRYSSLIWATLFGWLIWGAWPALPVFIGGGLVIACNMFIFYREHRAEKKDEVPEEEKSPL